MKKLLVMIFIGINLISHSNDITENIASLLDAANFYEKSGEIEKALETYNEILKKNPENKIAKKKSLILKGNDISNWSYQKKEDYFNEFEKHLETENYNDSNNIYTLGSIYMKEKSFERAYKVFTTDTSGDYRNYFGAGATANFLGKYDTAITYYKKTLAIKPNFYRCYLGLSTSYKLKGDFDKAIENMEIYLEHKKEKEVYIAISNLYMAKKNYDSAKLWLENGQKEFPNSIEIREALREVYQKN